MILGDAATRTEARPSSFRWKAFAIHLVASLLVLGALLFVLFYYWFPGYLFDTDGGWQALRVIAGVDIILGPLLTLIAANPKKSAGELRKDFTVIGVIQVCALTAGTWLAWDNRPWAMLWYDGVVYSMPWSAFRGEDSATAAVLALQSPHTPQRVVVDTPFDPLQRSALLERAAKDGTGSLLMDGRLYRPWPAPANYLKAFSVIALDMAEERAALDSALARIRATHADAVLVPVRSRYDIYFLAVAAGRGEVIEAIRLRPSEKLVAGIYSPDKLARLASEAAGGR
jgi:hypothetical protein